MFSTIPRGSLVKKPKHFHFSTKYARTDTDTLKVLLVKLNPPHAERQNLSIVFREIDTIMTAYFNLQRPLQGFQAGDCPYRLHVTKDGVRCIFRGYPPWFQTRLRLANGNCMQHPIQGADNIARGGRMIAVGLSPTASICVPFHVVRWKN